MSHTKHSEHLVFAQLAHRAVQFSFVVAWLFGCLITNAQPNIIHIVADDIGWTDLGTGATNDGNGSLFYQTPTIDSLAAAGMSFTSAYATQTCTPTRVAMMTGQYGTTTGVYNVGNLGGGGTLPLVGAANSRVIDGSAITVGETLQAAGYTTAHFGKFHTTLTTSAITTDHGYDFNFGGGAVGNGTSGALRYFAVGGAFNIATGPELDSYATPYTQAYIDDNLKPYANGNDVDLLVGTDKHLNDAMADAAIDFMQGQLSTSNAPFYMNVAFNAPHVPIEPRTDLHAKYNSIVAANAGISPDPRHTDAGYAGLVEGMDQAIARIVDFVQDPNGDGNVIDSIANDTVVLFYGDNGGFSGATENSPLRNAKGSQYEGGLRVPLIAWSPGQIAAGSSSNEMVHAVDFYPTFAELAGATLPSPAAHPLDGESIAGILTGQKTYTERDGLFSHFPGYQGANTPVSTTHLDKGNHRYKLLYAYENRAFELYDLNNDIGETNDLADGDMTALEYKLATRATTSLRSWLDATGAIYPTTTADATTVPPPSHLPQITFDMDATLNGLQSIQIDELGVRLDLEAGGLGATLNGNGDNLGISSSLDNTGGPNWRRRVDGSHATPETIEFSFDKDVFLKSLDLNAIDVSESVVLEFVSGDNPFSALSGYGVADGFTLGTDSLTFTNTVGSSTQLLDFGILGRDEVFLSAGTVLSLTADPAERGGLLLNAISIAQPLSAAESIYVDYDLDGDIDMDDYTLWQSTFGSTADLRADGNGNGIVDAADFVFWRDRYPGQLVAVPEPQGFVIVMFLFPMLLMGFRPKRRI